LWPESSVNLDVFCLAADFFDQRAN
jgi:hypothetical protein